MCALVIHVEIPVSDEREEKRSLSEPAQAASARGAPCLAGWHRRAGARLLSSSSASFAHKPNFQRFPALPPFSIWLGICCESWGISCVGFLFDGRPSGPRFY